MKPTFETHILGIVMDPDSFIPWMTWIDRQTGDATRVLAMRPIDDTCIPSPEDILARDTEIESLLGMPADDARALYKRSRADPDYHRVVEKYNAGLVAKKKRLVIEEN
jgi:hypothetical protein